MKPQRSLPMCNRIGEHRSKEQSVHNEPTPNPRKLAIEVCKRHRSANENNPHSNSMQSNLASIAQKSKPCPRNPESETNAIEVANHRSIKENSLHPNILQSKLTSIAQTSKPCPTKDRQTCSNADMRTSRQAEMQACSIHKASSTLHPPQPSKQAE